MGGGAPRCLRWLAMVEDDSVFHLSGSGLLGRHDVGPAHLRPVRVRRPGTALLLAGRVDRLRPVVGTCEPGRYKAQSAGDVALLKCLDRANLTCTPAVDTRGDALISAMRSQRKPQMLRLLEATRAGRRHCEAGKPSEPCTKGCWGGGAFGFHGNHSVRTLVTHFYRKAANLDGTISLHGSLVRTGVNDPRRHEPAACGRLRRACTLCDAPA